MACHHRGTPLPSRETFLLPASPPPHLNPLPFSPRKFPIHSLGHQQWMRRRRRRGGRGRQPECMRITGTEKSGRSNRSSIGGALASWNSTASPARRMLRLPLRRRWGERPAPWVAATAKDSRSTWPQLDTSGSAMTLAASSTTARRTTAASHAPFFLSSDDHRCSATRDMQCKVTPSVHSPSFRDVQAGKRCNKRISLFSYHVQIPINQDDVISKAKNIIFAFSQVSVEAKVTMFRYDKI